MLVCAVEHPRCRFSEAAVPVTAHAVRKLVLGGAPLATAAGEVDKLEAVVAAAAGSATEEGVAKLNAAVEAARNSVGGAEAEAEAEGEGEGEEEAAEA